MADAPREAWITGIGIVSALGEGPDAHWQRLGEPPNTADTTKFAPYVVHPIVPIDFDQQIPKKGDQRQMEPWQRIGTYAAGLALASAGAKGDTELLGRMDLVVAAGGGERDFAVDGAILSGMRTAENPGRFLNERLMGDLRPTLFLAQLSNLLAGNISIVHGVTGSSRTFMGEEAAGIDAVRIGLSRIGAGQSDIVLVGGAHNGERKDLLLLYEAGGHALKGGFAPVWEREALGGGMALGTLGAFLVLEAPRHAQARGAKPIARLTHVASDRSRREDGSVTASLARMWDEIAPRLTPDGLAVISGASGAESATRDEREFLRKVAKVPARATGTLLGHGLEAQFAMNVALAALAVSRGSLFAPGSTGEVEAPMTAPLRQAVVTGVGHWRGEGLALIEAAP